MDNFGNWVKKCQDFLSEIRFLTVVFTVVTFSCSSVSYNQLHYAFLYNIKYTYKLQVKTSLDIMY